MTAAPGQEMSWHRAFFEEAPAPMLVLDAAARVVHANVRAQQLLMPHGTPGSLVGVSLIDYLAASDQARVQEAVQRAVAEQRAFDCDAALAHGAPTPVWVHVQGTPHAGEPWRCWVVLEDITERQRQQAWLTERNALLTALSNNLPGMIYVFRAGADRAGHMEFVSEGVRDLFGASVEEALADIWALYGKVPREDVERFFAQRDDAGRQGARLHSEFRIIGDDGSVKWCAADSVQGVDAEGEPVRCGYISDITEHKLYQEARLAAETAERANRAKSEFLSRMSHELRTPLNAVIGFAQLLQLEGTGTLTDAQRHKVSLIERSGAHLLAVIGDVLDLSRIEAGDLPLSLEPLCLHTVVRDALDMVSEMASRNQVQMGEPDVSAGLQVQADRVRLRQVLVNLLSNASKYNRPGGRVCVRAWADAGQVAIEVRDDGIGMSAEQQAHLFEPFNRLGAELTGVEGTGIGLVIVQRLVELMGGRISVHSEPGRGSAFTVVLPMADNAVPTDPGALDVATPSGRQATVLYAEDNEINVMLLRQIFELRPSWQLVVARSGSEALELASTQHPDLVLIDMHLGDMSGLDLVDLMARDRVAEGVPRVALSADAMPDRIRTARAKGFVAYLTKPLDVGALLRCLDEHLMGVGQTGP